MATVLRILPGNHDEDASVAVAYFLLAWYRNEPRVVVDVDLSLFFRFRFGLPIGSSNAGDHVSRDIWGD
ncbi:hypothetical protein CES85_3944 [Ochrobactrum quorumnocens]|uniref:Uncharacterized protein n=1 Tax=Ochrobactrum quorumnocens TaxID=271865 RepID=A0A248U926_9HYPH|nr:hypothetical protein CES85_3944 [[Ochrobactrum] quorumnocens]